MDPRDAVWWRRPRRADATALALLIGIPLVLFAVPTLLGHPPVAWDNLLQNYPLRVLTGEILRSGHLPLLNPLADSGTPLLGGMNAGSLFPLSLLFVIPAPLAIWALNLIVVYAGAGVGLFSLLRWYGVTTWSAAVPALLYALTGAMNGQMIHLGVVEGFALLPWYVLCLEVLYRRLGDGGPGVRRLVPPVLGIAVLWALATLSGEPRAIADMELLGLIVIVARALVPGRVAPLAARLRWVGANAVGIVWGSLIGLAQLLPGWAVITESQRTHLSYWFFGSGSLAVRWSALWFLPDALGGNGMLGQPRFFANYNLPEVTGYVGLAAWSALIAFCLRRRRGGWRRSDRPFRLYLAVAVVGAFATWGSYTPLGRLYWWLPLFGSTRLQSRNVIILDLALLVLLGWWLDQAAHPESLDHRSPARRALVALPVLAAAGGLVTELVNPGALERWLGASGTAVARAVSGRPLAIVGLVVAVALLALLMRPDRSARWRRALIAVIVADAGVFALFSTTGLAPGHTAVMPSRAHAVAYLGSTGRFALVDPSGAHGDLYDRLGLPNINVFTGLPSVQGYGSLIDSLYGRVTATHPLFSLNACALARGTFGQLRLATVVVAADQLSSSLVGASARPLTCVRPRSTERLELAFGQMLPVRTIVLASLTSRAISTGVVTVRLLGARGRPVGPARALVGRSSLRFDFAGVARDAAGVEVTAPAGARVDSALVVERGAPAVTRQLVTPFQQALAWPAWRLVRTEGTVAYFHASSVRPPVWLARAPAGSRVVSVTDTLWGETVAQVVATGPLILKRSMAGIPGWHATATSQEGSRTISLHVVRSGLIQQVTVPQGRWTVHFTYSAPHLRAGLAGSALGIVAWIGALLWWRRRRPGRVRA